LYWREKPSFTSSLRTVSALMEPDRLLNDLRRETIPAVADLLHPRGLPPTENLASLDRRDGVDDARAASGSMKGRAKMVVV
jgi:hypothetical protein